jgi:hypothetical protein
MNFNIMFKLINNEALSKHSMSIDIRLLLMFSIFFFYIERNHTNYLYRIYEPQLYVIFDIIESSEESLNYYKTTKIFDYTLFKWFSID